MIHPSFSRTLRGVFALLLTITACSGEDDTGSSSQPCQAGSIQPCTCAATQTGTQKCLADGSAFGACVCGSGGAGGAGGHGASGGAGAGAAGKSAGGSGGSAGSGAAGASGQPQGGGGQTGGSAGKGGGGGVAGASGSGGVAGVSGSGGAAAGEGGAGGGAGSSGAGGEAGSSGAGGEGGSSGNSGSGGSAGQGGEGGSSGNGGAAGGQSGVWPDSATAFCADGAAKLDACPSPGSPAYGQDGSYVIDPPSYAQDGGDVVDLRTGLVWQGNPVPPGSLLKAQSYCAVRAMTTGQPDWRLPTLLEVLSIVDYGAQAPAVDTARFPGTTDGPYWTSSKSPDGMMWQLVFGDGSTSSGSPIGGVRCVRSQASGWDGALVPGDGVTDDPRIGRQWQRSASPPLVWLDAIAYCEGLSLGGKDDWRLPSVKELATLAVLVGGGQLGASLEGPSGAPAEQGRYWTSSPVVAKPANAWSIDFTSGKVMGLDATSSPLPVRCVR